LPSLVYFLKIAVLTASRRGKARSRKMRRETSLMVTDRILIYLSWLYGGCDRYTGVGGGVLGWCTGCINQSYEDSRLYIYQQMDDV
jgi:hypothetical protein